eukprot:TRINITY_DN7126_c0_g4_i2.p1 TRINITY_DN7126_c0_g4~~TRINITY_DN7126_c0_g4_i2.p1  ORF type:complete len:873 (-),score=207.14 TRINITY_DN7126_c0_g4_i2:162-2645(-)
MGCGAHRRTQDVADAPDAWAEPEGTSAPAAIHAASSSATAKAPERAANASATGDARDGAGPCGSSAAPAAIEAGSSAAAGTDGSLRAVARGDAGATLEAPGCVEASSGGGGPEAAPPPGAPPPAPIAAPAPVSATATAAAAGSAARKANARKQRTRGSRPFDAAEAALDLLANLDMSSDSSSARGDDDPCSTTAATSPARAVEVSLSTRKVLFQWHRWAKNSLRILAEEKIKKLQHTRYVRTALPHPPSPALSPQPTPRGAEGSSRTALGETAPPLTPRGAQPAEAAAPSGAAASSRSRGREARSAGAGSAAGAGIPAGSPRSPAATRSRVALRSRSGASAGLGSSSGSTGEPSLFASLRDDQRQSMGEQGVKLKLCQGLGAGAAVAQSTGTPGFGIETPNFVGAHSRTSANASVAASVMSSGVASPAGNGQISPWILEAEALVNGASDDEDLCSGFPRVTAAWGAAPAALESSPVVAAGGNSSNSPLSIAGRLVLGSGGAAGSAAAGAGAGALAGIAEGCGQSSLLNGDLETIIDHDELEQADILAEVFAPRSAGESPEGKANASPSGPKTAAEASTLKAITSPAAKALAGAAAAEAASPEASASPPAGGSPGLGEPGYSPGEVVRYWSSTRSCWLPARVVERKSRNVYLVDKQMKGCVSKVRATDIISDAEERANPALRALAALEADEDVEVKRTRPSRSPSARGSAIGSSSVARGTPRGGAGSSPRLSAPPRMAPPPRTASAAESHVSGADRGGGSDAVGGAGVPRARGGRGGAPSGSLSPPAARAAAVRLSSPTAATAVRPPTPPALRGRVVRDDFSDDSDDD